MINKDLEHLTIREVSLGSSHTLILDSSGYVYAAGSPDYGQLGSKYFHPKACEMPYVIVGEFSVAHPCA